MRPTTLLLFSLIALGKSLNCLAQTSSGSLQIGPVLSFYQQDQTAWGGEVIGNINLQKKIAMGAGVQALKLLKKPSVYLPTFARLKISSVISKAVCFFHLDPGYSFFNSRITSHQTIGGFTDLTTDAITKGGFYLGAGFGIHGVSNSAPYFNLQYSLYKLETTTTYIDNYIQSSSTEVEKTDAHAITLTLGLWLNFHARK